MKFSVLLSPDLNMPLKRVSKAADLDVAIADAKAARTSVATQSVQVWENWPPRGKEQLRWIAKTGEAEGSIAAPRRNGGPL